MRIRKNASKILGSASTSFPSSYSPPKMPSTSDVIITASSSSELSICDFNCSPWDIVVVDSNNHGFHNFNFTSVEDSKEERYCIKIKEESFAAAAAESSPNEKINEQSKEKNKIRYCTKRGKGWDCKKPSQIPHSFCEYHLEKLRASMSRKIRKSTCNVTKNQVIRNRPTKLEASLSESNSCYYYYGGFGPWRGKRRVRADVEVKEVAAICKDNDDDNDKLIGENRAEERITYCRKTDGKKWRCKRPAQLPHSTLCSHHLTQSQLFNYNYSKSGARRKIKCAVKRPANGLKSKEDELEAGEVGINIDVAGDDEDNSYGGFDRDGKDIDDEDNSYGGFDHDGKDIDDDDDDERSDHVNEGEVKKRREPMKARSLKSLL